MKLKFLLMFMLSTAFMHADVEVDYNQIIERIFICCEKSKALQAENLESKYAQFFEKGVQDGLKAALIVVKKYQRVICINKPCNKIPNKIKKELYALTGNSDQISYENTDLEVNWYQKGIRHGLGFAISIINQI